MPTLSIALLGSFTVTKCGQPISNFAYDKVRALLAYLAVEADRPHRRDHLAALFWPEQPRRSGLQSLSQALYQLRRALGDSPATPFLLVTTQTVQFDPEGDAWLDVREFVDLLDACRTHCHTWQAACPECLARLEQAVSLVHGDFLAGFSLSDSPGYDEWALLQAERLRRLTTEALRTLVAGHERRGECVDALAYAQRWLALDPWQEEAHRAVMTALAASGQRNAALAQFEACRRVLAAELAVEPSAETVALYQRIRSPGAMQSARHNLPAPLTPLIGRANELAAIIHCLQEPGCRLVSLVGPGGIGKTRLALEAAANLLDDFADGVFLAPLVAIDSTAGIVLAIAQAIGLALARQEDAWVQLIQFLRSKQMLLVLDNFEHLLPGAHLLVEILAAAPQIKVMVTSRTRLNCIGEQVIAVEGLTLPAPVAAEGEAYGHDGLAPAAAQAIVGSDAVALFLFYAWRIRRGFEPNAADLAAIVRICRAVAGMPLAILLAAAWMHLLSPAEIAQQLLGELTNSGGHGIDFLAADWPDLPERQRSMRAVLGHAWHLLSEQDRRVLAGLTVFHGGFTQNAANAVVGATLRQLRTLVEKSWLHRSAENRYEIHELLRQFAEEKLEQTPATAFLVRDRHCAHFAACLAGWANELAGKGQLTALAEIEADLDNARAAWTWAVAQANFDQLDQALDGLCLYFDWRGRCQQGEEMCQKAVERLRPHVIGLQIAVLARLLTWQGWFSQLLGQVEVATAQLHQSLAALDDSALAGANVRGARAYALYALGHAAYGANRAAARQHWEESVALYRTVADGWGLSQALTSLGHLALDLSEFSTARRLLEESLAISQAAGDRKSMAHALCYLSNVFANQGELSGAMEMSAQSVALSQALGDRLGAAESMGRLAGALAYAGKLAESAARFEQAAATYHELGAANGYALYLHLLAWINCNLGKYDLARQQYQSAQAIWLERSHRHGLALSSLGLGGVALVFEDFERASALLADAVTGFTAVQQQDEQAIALALLACALRGLGRCTEAQACVRQSLLITRATGAFAPALFALHAEALILADAGDARRALELYTLAGQHPYLAHSRWRQDCFGRYLDPLAANLPAGERGLAIEAGQRGDITAAVIRLLAESGTGETSSVKTYALLISAGMALAGGTPALPGEAA